MSSICPATIAMEPNAQMLQENWAWVDQRLEELYHRYGLVEENCDDYIEAGFLGERWAWVDEELQRQLDSEFEERIPCPAHLHWVYYKDYPKQYCLEDEDASPRSRAESDISDHSAEVERALERLDLQSPLPQGMYPIDYCYSYALADEVASLDPMENGFDDCSTISHCSDTSTLIDLDEDIGYDSF